MPNFYDNFLLPYFWFPPIPKICDKPPTVYSILESIVNYGKEDKEKIKDLAKYGRGTIFDFDYPLSSYVSKEDFETIILNHYLMRRIGFETVTAFKIQLNVKLNEIMPTYNKLFNLLYETSGLGEITSKEGIDNRVIDTNSDTTNKVTNTSENNTTNINDRRYSDTPQDKLEEVRDGSYVTEYNYETNTSNSKDNSEQNGTSNNKLNTKDDKTYKEVTSKVDLFDVYMNINDKKMHIYSMIFKELDLLFYSLV